MATIRCLRPLAELTSRRSQNVIHPSWSLAIASRNYYNCSCRTNKPLNTMTVSPTILFTQQRATYTSTTTTLSASSPFRLNSSQKPHQQTPENEENYKYEYEGEEEEGEYYSPYKPKRQWPPDMSKLSPKHQLRLERKYRRRAALKYARPRWVKFTKLAQWGIIIFVVIYSLLFMEWGKEGEVHPFEDFRKDFFASINSLFSAPQPPSRKKE